MKAMILAAGRGERLRPLTDHIPKPMLPVCGEALIIHHLKRLRQAGFRDFVINLHHLGELIETALGNGQDFGVRITYSRETPNVLETGGGILQALPLLGQAPFFVINADIWTDYLPTPPKMSDNMLAKLVLVPNPTHNPEGDFSLTEDGRLENNLIRRYTFSGMGWYRPALFADCKQGRFPLAPLLRNAAAAGRIGGELYRGTWSDIGTPERLAQVDCTPPD